MQKITNEIQERLMGMQDLKYRDFHSRLMPNVDKEAVIGVRMPMIRKYAKELSKRDDINEFLNTLPHRYYEENNIHAAIISDMKKDLESVMKETEKFLPYVDNWATCDMFLPKIFKEYPDEVYEKCKKWLKSGKTYTIRFGIDILMSLYLDEYFKPEMLNAVVSVKSEEYYVNMAIAWYMSFALIKQYEAALPILEKKILDKWVHNKSIQKAVESRRISNDVKVYLKTLKIK